MSATVVENKVVFVGQLLYFFFVISVILVSFLILENNYSSNLPRGMRGWVAREVSEWSPPPGGSATKGCPAA